MYLTLGLIVVFLGVGMVMIGWLLFRRPGVPFWTFAPVWQANRYLKLPGAALWVAGCVVGLIGLVLHLAGATV